MFTLKYQERLPSLSLQPIFRLKANGNKDKPPHSSFLTKLAEGLDPEPFLLSCASHTSPCKQPAHSSSALFILLSSNHSHEQWHTRHMEEIKMLNAYKQSMERSVSKWRAWLSTTVHVTAMVSWCKRRLYWLLCGSSTYHSVAEILLHSCANSLTFWKWIVMS